MTAVELSEISAVLHAQLERIIRRRLAVGGVTAQPHFLVIVAAVTVAGRRNRNAKRYFQQENHSPGNKTLRRNRLTVHIIQLVIIAIIMLMIAFIRRPNTFSPPLHVEPHCLIGERF